VKKQDNLIEKRKKILDEAKEFLLNGNLGSAAKAFRDVAIICSDLGEFEQSMNFSNQADKLGRLFRSTQEAVLRA
jgi:hypothetical protein